MNSEAHIVRGSVDLPDNPIDKAQELIEQAHDGFFVSNVISDDYFRESLGYAELLTSELERLDLAGEAKIVRQIVDEGLAKGSPNKYDEARLREIRTIFDDITSKLAAKKDDPMTEIDS